MTQYTFMSGQTVASNAPNGPTPAEVVITGGPTLGHVSLSVTGPNAGGTQAALWCQTATTPYGYTQQIPLLVMYIPPGQKSAPTQRFALSDLEYNQFFFGWLSQIDASGLTAATMTMVV